MGGPPTVTAAILQNLNRGLCGGWLVHTFEQSSCPRPGLRSKMVRYNCQGLLGGCFRIQKGCAIGRNCSETPKLSSPADTTRCQILQAFLFFVSANLHYSASDSWKRDDVGESPDLNPCPRGPVVSINPIATRKFNFFRPGSCSRQLRIGAPAKQARKTRKAETRSHSYPRNPRMQTGGEAIRIGISRRCHFEPRAEACGVTVATPGPWHRGK